MNDKIRKIIMIIAAAVLILSAAMIIYKNVQYKVGSDAYADADKLVSLPDVPSNTVPVPASTPAPQAPVEVSAAPVICDDYADELAQMDLTQLQGVNPDVLGWIVIPDTIISYPLVQGEDNDYYLVTTWQKTKNSVGSIFLDYRCTSDLSDFNSIIYGHRMRNESMFGSLKYYSKEDYWREHPYIYISDAAGCKRYAIFSVYEVSVLGDTYKMSFSDDSEKRDYIDFCVSSSIYDTGIVPETDDNIITLSTCTGYGHSTRWIVQAVLDFTAERQSTE